MPPRGQVGGELLDDVYNEIMDRVCVEVRNAAGCTLGIDGVTENLAKSKSVVIIHTPFPFFTEYLKSDLQRETIRNVVKMIEDAIESLDELIGFAAQDLWWTAVIKEGSVKKLQEKNLIKKDQ